MDIAADARERVTSAPARAPQDSALAVASASPSPSDVMAPTVPRGAVAGVAAAGASIGPNAILQLVAALRAGGHDALIDPIFKAARCREYLATPPTRMVPERDVRSLFSGLYAIGPREVSALVAADAGRRTADYILAYRIPAPAAKLLRALPAAISARLLARAIAANAWTFCGSGAFSARVCPRLVLSIAANPLAVPQPHASAPACHWHCAVFERLFEALAHRETRVTEATCCARGDQACTFVVDW